MRQLLLGLICNFLMAAASFAHHSAAGRFDSNVLTELEGEVTRVSWVNPHIYMTLRTTDENGQTVNWKLEAAPPGMLRRRGIEREDIQVGDNVRVAGWSPVTSEKEIFLTNLLSRTGEELLITSNAKPYWNEEAIGAESVFFRSVGDSSQPELGIYRVWSYTFSSKMLFPESFGSGHDVLSMYPLTDEAVEAVRNYDGATQNPTLRCEPKGMPAAMESPLPIEFIRDDEAIRIHMEAYDLTRTIDMRSDAVPTEQSASLLGSSIGWWDTSTLVVTTTNINWGWFNQSGIPLHEDAVVVERFTPTPDGSRLDYTMTVTDPRVFTEPVTREKFWLYFPDEKVEPDVVDCEAGNY